MSVVKKVWENSTLRCALWKHELLQFLGYEVHTKFYHTGNILLFLLPQKTMPFLKIIWKAASKLHLQDGKKNVQHT